jgi:hypothetical protein
LIFAVVLSEGRTPAAIMLRSGRNPMPFETTTHSYAVKFVTPNAEPQTYGGPHATLEVAESRARELIERTRKYGIKAVWIEKITTVETREQFKLIDIDGETP